MACVLHHTLHDTVLAGDWLNCTTRIYLGEAMRQYVYVPVALFFIIISMAGKTFATAITDVQDIIDWLGVTFKDSGFADLPDQVTGLHLEDWGNGLPIPLKKLPPGNTKTSQLFTNTLVKSNYGSGTAVQPFIDGHAGSMTISASLAAGEPTAFGIGEAVSNPAESGLLSRIVPVPEPGTMLLFGTGLLGLAGSRLRRKRLAVIF